MDGDYESEKLALFSKVGVREQDLQELIRAERTFAKESVGYESQPTRLLPSLNKALEVSRKVRYLGFHCPSVSDTLVELIRAVERVANLKEQLVRDHRFHEYLKGGKDGGMERHLVAIVCYWIVAHNRVSGNRHYLAAGLFHYLGYTLPSLSRKATFPPLAEADGVRDAFRKLLERARKDFRGDPTGIL